MEAVDYLERGAAALLPPPTRKPKGQYLELILRMKQWIPHARADGESSHILAVG